MAESVAQDSQPPNTEVLTGERHELSNLTDAHCRCKRGDQCDDQSAYCENGRLNGMVAPMNKECSCNKDPWITAVDKKNQVTHNTKLALPETSCHDSVKKQGNFVDVDSGVHSGTDNCSDSKSSSSSPGLSTESSAHDLSDKSDVKKSHSKEPLTVNESENEVTNEHMDKLADTLSKQASLHDSTVTPSEGDSENGIEYVVYESEVQMPDIMRLITKDLSEPYSIYTYRYFIHNWPKLCFLAKHEGECVGAIVCKLDMHKKMVRRGYIAMLAVDQKCRRKRIGSHLVLKAIRTMIDDDCDEVVLETEITNKAALRLYENLGFVRDKRLFRYYLNGVDALRLKLWLR